MKTINIFKCVKMDDLARLANQLSKEKNSVEATKMVLSEINSRLKESFSCNLKKRSLY